jgi:hypothetical protein
MTIPHDPLSSKRERRGDCLIDREIKIGGFFKWQISKKLLRKSVA